MNIHHGFLRKQRYRTIFPVLSKEIFFQTGRNTFKIKTALCSQNEWMNASCFQRWVIKWEKWATIYRPSRRKHLAIHNGTCLLLFEIGVSLLILSLFVGKKTKKLYKNKFSHLNNPIPYSEFSHKYYDWASMVRNQPGLTWWRF